MNAPRPTDQTLSSFGLAELPDYAIKKELGRGGMGVVYLAHNTLLGRDEVLKVMGHQIISRPGLLDRFLREMKAVARLRHPNIVTAYSATRIGESIVFAMEYVEGLDLSKVVKAKGPLPVSHACHFAYQAALGLEHAFEEGLVHRDIKPANLMLSRKGDKATVKVLDFGLAKVAREEKVDGGLTSEGQALGTPDFIAPEQIVNAPNVDIRADIYSLGGTLFYLLTGRPPFQANSLYDIYQAHISRDADWLNLVRPEVPAELAALVAKMMAKDPVRRFQTPGEVAKALIPFFQKVDGALNASHDEPVYSVVPLAGSKSDEERLRRASAGSAGKASSTRSERRRDDSIGTRKSAPTELPPQFGRYRVKKKLGGGGMGSVYLVENTELERDEALKVPHFSDGDDPQVRERFLREAKWAARLDHANLCSIYDAGVQDGIYYLTMRFLKGRLLSDYIGKPQPQRKVIEIVGKLAVALQTAHAREVIHRDLKPSNIMIVTGVGPVVMDFGLAKAVRQADSKLTQEGSMLGTPAYMPPEQVNGDQERMGPASDIYSLGVIFYELLTGRLPFEGSMAAILGKILYTEPPTPSSLVPGLNPALGAICQKAMSRSPTDRYPSMKAFAAALTEFLRSIPATAGAGSLVPNVVDKADVFQASTVAPGPQAGAMPTRRVRKPTRGAIDPSPPLARPRVWSNFLIVIGIACAFFAIAIGLWASGLLRVRTADGILVVQVNEPDPDLYVDGEKVTAVWQNGGMKAEVTVKPGTRKVELKKDGFRAYGEEVTLEDHGRTVLAARLDPFPKPTPPPVNPSEREPDKKGAPADGNGAPPKVVASATSPPPVEPMPTPLPNEVPPRETRGFVVIPENGRRVGAGNNVLNMEFCWCQALRGFSIGKYEVTQSEWARLMGSLPSHTLEKGKGDRFPIYYVSHGDAVEFCRTLTELERKSGRLSSRWQYRLPTEEEWELACRAGTTTFTAFGDSLSSTQANFNGDWPHGAGQKGPSLMRAVEVGSYRPNAWGIYDMHGNVKELTTTPGRVRGGAWGDNGRNCGSSIFMPGPQNACESVGFRVARVPTD
jgi:serine/threonine protein kinase